MANGSITVYPSAVDEANTNVTNAAEALGRGWDSPQYINLANGKAGNVQAAYRFDFSAIPANAVITDVSCKAAAKKTTNNTEPKGYVGLTLDGQILARLTLKTAINAEVLHASITRVDLDRLEFRVWGTSMYGGLSNSFVRYFGADLIVQYTYNNEQFYIKISGAWQPVQTAYKKVGGVWVEQTELSAVVEPGVKYKLGTV